MTPAAKQPKHLLQKDINSFIQVGASCSPTRAAAVVGEEAAVPRLGARGHGMGHVCEITSQPEAEAGAAESCVRLRPGGVG